MQGKHRQLYVIHAIVQPQLGATLDITVFNVQMAQVQ
jgi:hypothetical protein